MCLRRRRLRDELDRSMAQWQQQEGSAAKAALLDAVGGRPGHIFGLGHGVMKQTSPEAVAEAPAVTRRLFAG